jgi:LacI family transcriptional regulator
MRRVAKIVLRIESSRGSGRAFLRGIAQYARYHGPWSFYWEARGIESAWPVLKKLEPDGIIMRDVEKVDEVLALGIPAIVLGHKREEVPGVINVITDSPRIGQMGAEHLLQCGFRNFAFCGYARSAVENASWSQLRQQYFCEGIQRAGFNVETYTLLSLSTGDWSGERRMLTEWLKNLEKPVGIMACNDDCGVQVMGACKLAGLAVPDEVGVIGVDDDEIVCGLATPAMSSIAINFEKAGFEAAEALDRLIRKNRNKRQRILVQPTHVVPRASTDIVAVSDEAIAKTLRYIRDHSRQTLTVAEVAHAVGFSRRALERRFRLETNSSMLKEIRKARTDQIARMLVETSLPVAQIAESLGFEDVQHFARYFRSGKQMSPLAYRKRYGTPVHATVAQNGGYFAQTGVVTLPTQIA